MTNSEGGYRELYDKLGQVQLALAVPKSNYNSFGGYNYRSAEDIEKAAKPILREQGLTMYTTFSLEELAGRVYVCAMTTITDGEVSVSSTAYAREADQQKGMVAPQLSGSAHSFAKKYAMSALLCLDDGVDADSTNTGEGHNYSKPVRKPKSKKSDSDGPKKAAWLNIQGYAEANGLDPMAVVAEVKSRPDFDDNPAYWVAVAAEFGA